MLMLKAEKNCVKFQKFVIKTMIKSNYWFALQNAINLLQIIWNLINKYKLMCCQKQINSDFNDMFLFLFLFLFLWRFFSPRKCFYNFLLLRSTSTFCEHEQFPYDWTQKFFLKNIGKWQKKSSLKKFHFFKFVLYSFNSEKGHFL
jgi:hypothetical protein